MKTDNEKLKELLTEFGVGFEEIGIDIVCDSGVAKVKGYSGFSTWFNFNEKGDFIEMGAYE